MILEEDVLEHFGIKGMRWGVITKGKTGSTKSNSVLDAPKASDATADIPKPKTRSRLAERNLRVNTQRYNTLRARAAKSDVRIAEIKTELVGLPKYSKKARELRYEKSVTIQQRNKDLDKAKKPPSDGLTPTQKKLLIGAGVAGVIIGYHVATKYANTDAEGIGAAIRRGQSQIQHGSMFKPAPGFARVTKLEDVMDVVLPGINPNYRTQGGAMNCRRATFAYELRRRGHDVVATTAPMGYGQNESGLVNALIKGDRNLLSRESMSAFSGMSTISDLSVRTRAAPGDTRTYEAYTESVKKIGKLRESLSKQPTGARGEVVFDMGAFAHSMQWEIFDGVPHIFDAQKAQHFPTTPSGLASLMSKWGSPEVMEITRLDNVDLDMAFLSRWVANA